MSQDRSGAGSASATAGVRCAPSNIISKPTSYGDGCASRMNSTGPPLTYDGSNEASVISGRGITVQRAPSWKYLANTGVRNWVSKYRDRSCGGVSMISSPTMSMLSRMFSGGTTAAGHARGPDLDLLLQRQRPGAR